MYSKFNCDISNYFYNEYIKQYHETGRKIYENFQQQCECSLKPFLLDNGHIDGTALKDIWFSISNADVFISHSHKDIEKVKAFAGWLKGKFGLTAFIDSCAWGYCDDLLKLIDDKFCKHQDEKTYDYKLRNYTTSHVHTMLSAALLDMIDRTECLIFYNTPQSICLKDELNKVDKAEKTLSPWIYSELSATRVLRCQKPDRSKRLSESFEYRDSSKFNDSKLPHIEYDVSASIENMIKLNDDVLIEWESKHTTGEYSLDTLYKLVGPK